MLTATDFERRAEMIEQAMHGVLAGGAAPCMQRAELRTLRARLSRLHAELHEAARRAYWHADTGTCAECCHDYQAVDACCRALRAEIKAALDALPRPTR